MTKSPLVQPDHLLGWPTQFGSKSAHFFLSLSLLFSPVPLLLLTRADGAAVASHCSDRLRPCLMPWSPATAPPPPTPLIPQLDVFPGDSNRARRGSLTLAVLARVAGAVPRPRRLLLHLPADHDRLLELLLEHTVSVLLLPASSLSFSATSPHP